MTSRKLWLAVSAFVAALLIFFHVEASAAENVAALVMAGGAAIAYIVGEGFSDGKNGGE